ncbi:hypothetical protein B0T25DRAFT_129049 [Lasiosphaeria hispida]|uniref:Uncharacterized protein n=1 Tax=Lasiosphaeria hispida TaxID=260671 RepID=A0AAJ0HSE6_9PEZI|nr:hypothetical protein B0T25DRAFT_129049 [Lasiosphaeria hispida]
MANQGVGLAWASSHCSRQLTHGTHGCAISSITGMSQIELLTVILLSGETEESMCRAMGRPSMFLVRCVLDTDREVTPSVGGLQEVLLARSKHFQHFGLGQRLRGRRSALCPRPPPIASIASMSSTAGAAASILARLVIFPSLNIGSTGATLVPSTMGYRRRHVGRKALTCLAALQASGSAHRSPTLQRLALDAIALAGRHPIGIWLGHIINGPRSPLAVQAAESGLTNGL